MATNNRLFGSLHTPLPLLNFDGAETSSIVVMVDDANMIIKAELADSVKQLINSHTSGISSLNQIINELKAAQQDKNASFNSRIEQLLTDLAAVADELASTEEALEALEQTVSNRLDVLSAELTAQVSAVQSTLQASIDQVSGDTAASLLTVANRVSNTETDISALQTKDQELDAEIQRLSNQTVNFNWIDAGTGPDLDLI